ncbi:MAG: phage major capsid protein [Clostridia bacterium]|jgi:hypothetical protein|nr:phage major capsid protein [Clostridia bacterium]
MNYNNIKLEKDMYNVCNKSFTDVLEELDPSEQYRGTELENLDAYQRQLKRFGIKVSGPNCDNVEKFFLNPLSAVLFPEFINRAIEKGIYYYNNVLPSVIATKSTVDTLDYRTITSNMETATFSGNEVRESEYLPEIYISTNSNLISLKKHGRLITSTYEALRFQNLDVIAVLLRKMGSDIVNEQLKDAITVMQTDTTPQAVSSLSYDSLLTLWSALKPYNMNVMITRYDVAKRILALNEMKDAQAGLDFQGTGRNITPLGAKLICSPWVNANTIIGLDKNCALQMIQSGKVTLDYNKLIDKQIEKAGISVRAGFAKIFAGAIKIISLSA